MLASSPGGIYSFFNGLAPDNIFFHTVEGRVAQLELQALGLRTSYERVPIKEAIDERVWEGVKNKYWCVERWSEACLPIKEAIDRVLFFLGGREEQVPVR